MNISSIVVKTSPVDFPEVLEKLESSGLCEVRFHDDTGRIVAIVESRDMNEGIEKMKAIINAERVLSVDLVYSCSEDEAAAGEPPASRSPAVPRSLR